VTSSWQELALKKKKKDPISLVHPAGLSFSLSLSLSVCLPLSVHLCVSFLLLLLSLFLSVSLSLYLYLAVSLCLSQPRLSALGIVVDTAGLGVCVCVCVCVGVEGLVRKHADTAEVTKDATKAPCLTVSTSEPGLCLRARLCCAIFYFLNEAWRNLVNAAYRCLAVC